MSISNVLVSVKKHSWHSNTACTREIIYIQNHTMNKVDIKYSYAILIKCVLRAVLNDTKDGESLRCSGKSSHNEDTAEANDLSPHGSIGLDSS